MGVGPVGAVAARQGRRAMTGDDIARLVLMAAVIFAMSAGGGYLLARRHGAPVIWGALILGAVACVIGWLMTRTPLFGAAALRQSILIYFILLPSYVALTGGALIGALRGRLTNP